MDTMKWLLLTYKVPPEPAAKRIALWRRLKGMGAIYLQNGVCLLPKTDDHVRRLKMLENEAAEMGGEAVILETVALDRAQEEKVIARFKADRDEAYREFIDKCDDFEKEIAKETEAEHFTYAELEENDVDLKKLQGWLEKIGKLDFYGGALAEEAARRLKGCEALLDTYAQRVFEAHDENR
ncbi:MAG: chromate resistance protein ChrB [Mesorhizobium sp.]|uniref:Chromate resistance protein ChrB n=1 Tax=Mesorhizobium sp. TaxID=1871066 RepID=UPI000FE4C90B|nr:Chromate resistance protein ChrB [Mesorhizobium sp.]RWJ21131.1 MAG: chromate resistance protein ChrB [Mesorhizobium sp.]